ncbi:MAG TPA: ATP-binding cassette domain-containing protein, partial [Ilumatobacteraceae bacterium]|nr:ATP-binding cassette domain-containing protein [Ilumatobacteraceae bacterium]
VAAARAAQADGFIALLPQGYDTEIGGQRRLSGGEAQRIAIARALVADTPVVVLDEATAFADPESERNVQLALANLLAGRTVLVIAHRLHTVVDADQIIVLDGGRIVQRGRHADLVAA